MKPSIRIAEIRNKKVKIGVKTIDDFIYEMNRYIEALEEYLDEEYEKNNQ